MVSFSLLFFNHFWKLIEINQSSSRQHPGEAPPAANPWLNPPPPCSDPHPRQAVPAAELPSGDVGGTGVAIQDDVGSLWVGHKVKLPAHCGVSPGCVNTKAQRSCSAAHTHPHTLEQHSKHTVGVSSHDVEGFQLLRQGRLQLDSDSQVGEGGRGHQSHLNTPGQKSASAEAIRHCSIFTGRNAHSRGPFSPLQGSV